MNKIWTCSEGCVIAMSVKDHSSHSFVQHMCTVYVHVCKQLDVTVRPCVNCLLCDFIPLYMCRQDIGELQNQMGKLSLASSAPSDSSWSGEGDHNRIDY